MNRNFITGTVFGVALGITVAMAVPMNAATDIKIGKPTKPAAASNQANSASNLVSHGNDSAGMDEIVKQLKEINKTLKEHTDQNKKIVEEIHQLNQRFSFPGGSTPAPN